MAGKRSAPIALLEIAEKNIREAQRILLNKPRDKKSYARALKFMTEAEVILKKLRQSRVLLAGQFRARLSKIARLAGAVSMMARKQLALLTDRRLNTVH